MARPAELICCGREFKVPKRFLAELELFDEDPSLLKQPYSVNSDVSLRIFETFVDALTGKDVDATLDNYTELAILSKEFGFHCLDEKIVEAKKENEAVKDVGLLNRLRRIEKAIELIQGDSHGLSRLEPRVTALERRIASVPANVTAQITAERKERIANVRDLNSAVQAQAAKLDNTVAAKLDHIAAQITDGRKSRQSDTKNLKAKLQQPQAPPSAPTQTPKMAPAPTSGAKTDFKLADEKFDGVIRHLTEIGGGNPADKGLVDLTANGVWRDHRKPRNALDLDNVKNSYGSDDEPNHWFCLDFKARKVSVTHYSLRSSYLKFWVLEGSRDGIEWDQLDKRNNNTDMKKTGEASFSVAKRGELRFIRLRQTGKNHDRSDVLRLTKIELFGTLIE